MKTPILVGMTASIAAVFAAAAFGQQSAQVDTRATATREPPEAPDIIVRGRRIGDLRLEIERSEEALFARFNEINSTDEFDIHCRGEKVHAVRQRFCMSNSWRKQSANMARATVRAMRGEGNGSEAVLYRKEQLRKQGLLTNEMRQLATEDEQLREALADLSEAQLALTARLGTKTLSREVEAYSGTLPYDAHSMFEVIMGNNPWRHRLTESTFTIADVFGEIRRLEVECAEGNRRFDYDAGLDWTVPSGWSSCTVQVSAKRATTFRLYEF